MAETTIPNYPHSVYFEEIRTILNEASVALKEASEMQKETEQQMKENAEQQKEIAERQKETDRLIKETDRQIKKTNRQMGGLHRRFGELAEHLVAPGIHARFNELGYHFGSISPGGHKIIGGDGKIKTEIDILLENSDTIMAVEVKTRPAVKDMEHHIRRLEILRDYRRSINDSRKIQGAIAGAVFGTEEKKAALEAGLYALEQSGDTMKIDVPDGFIPREW